MLGWVVTTWDKAKGQRGDQKNQFRKNVLDNSLRSKLCLCDFSVPLFGKNQAWMERWVPCLAQVLQIAHLYFLLPPSLPIPAYQLLNIKCITLLLDVQTFTPSRVPIISIAWFDLLLASNPYVMQLTRCVRFTRRMNDITSKPQAYMPMEQIQAINWWTVPLDLKTSLNWP